MLIAKMKVLHFCINNFLNIFIKLSSKCAIHSRDPPERSLNQINICVISLTFVYMIFVYHSVKYMYMQSVDATWALWSFIGQLSTNNQNIKWQGMLCKGDIFIINVCTWMINRCGLPLDGQIIIKGQKYLNSTSFSRLRERRRFNKSKNKCWPKYFKNIFLLQKTF